MGQLPQKGDILGIVINHLAVVTNLLQTSDLKSQESEIHMVAEPLESPQILGDLTCREPCSIIIHLWSQNSEIQLHVVFGSEKISWFTFVSRLTEFLGHRQSLLLEIMKSSKPTQTVAMFASLSSPDHRAVTMEAL